MRMRAEWTWRTAFDVGEYDLGQYAEPLQKGVDVPDNAYFFDEVAPSDTGSAGGTLPLPHAVAVYEHYGVSILKKAWINTDGLWAAAFIGAGALTLVT